MVNFLGLHARDLFIDPIQPLIEPAIDLFRLPLFPLIMFYFRLERFAGVSIL